MEAKIETKIEARRRLHIKAKTLPIGEGFVIVTSRFRATTRCRPMVFLLAFPKGKASHYRPVPPSSHRSKASVGFCRALHGLHCIPHARKRRACKYRVKAQPCFGRPHRVAPTMSVSKCGFYRAPTKRQRSAFCGKEEVPAPKAKVFRRKTEQLRRAPTTGRPYGSTFQNMYSPGWVEPHPYEIRGNRYNFFPLMSSAHWVKAKPCFVGKRRRRP